MSAHVCHHPSSFLPVPDSTIFVANGVKLIDKVQNTLKIGHNDMRALQLQVSSTPNLGATVQGSRLPSAGEEAAWAGRRWPCCVVSAAAPPTAARALLRRVHRCSPPLCLRRLRGACCAASAAAPTIPVSRLNATAVPAPAAGTDSAYGRSPGVSCGAVGEVVALNVTSSPGHTLAGTLSPTITALWELLVLALPSHVLSGPLSPAI